MQLEEKTSKHLGIPFIELEVDSKKYYLCHNGVLFADSEYMDYADLNAEYERREKEDKLYDYAYCKSTGRLRKKRGKSPDVSEIQKLPVSEQKRTSETANLLETKENDKENTEADEAPVSSNDNRNTLWKDNRALKGSESENGTDKISGADAGRWENTLERWNYSGSFRPEETERNTTRSKLRLDDGRRAVGFIIALLAFTSVISGYISTLQTATYLYDYVDMISAWLMSASVTAYNVTAFEVAVLFKQNRRYGLTFVFITLWVTVTFFSMATAVSVFYDRFNFNESQIAEENKEVDSNKLAIELLRTKEKDLRDAIEFKKKDIEYRQEKDYATATVRSELVKLEEELQANLSEQQKLLSDTPEVMQEVTKKKEKLFAFLGRILRIDSGVFEFTMSTLSAIFVNLIAPMSIVAVAELKKKKLDKTN